MAEQTGSQELRLAYNLRMKSVVKQIICAAILIGACLVVTLGALAHGGGLDTLGCHHDRQRGGYHCHRGPLAGRSFKDKAEAEKALLELQKPSPPPASSETGGN
jgi:hypothetical protein